MAYNKIEANGDTLIDLTSDTVTADTLVSGRTAHLASGERVTGTFEPVTGVKGNAESTYRKGDVNLTPANLGLGNVNNTSDLNKPISTATQTALDGKAPLTSNNSIDFVSSGVTWNDSSSNTYDRMSTYTSRNKTAWLVSNPAYDIGIGLASDDSKAWIEAWVDYPSNTSNGLIEFYDTYIDIRKDDDTAPMLRLSKSPSTVDSKWRHGNKSITLNNSGITFDNITIPYANNAGFHNSIFRGKYLGNSYTSAQKAQVQAGTFNDLFVGDYWTINDVDWVIADINYYYGFGDIECTIPHLVIVPRYQLLNARMNSTNTTTGGYLNSEIKTITLLCDSTTALDTSTVYGKICAAFGENNILSHSMYFTNAVDSSGNVSGWAWANSKVDLLTQCQVFGEKIWSSGAYDGFNTGIQNTQLAAFRLNRSFIINKATSRAWYKLCDVRSATQFIGINSRGSAGALNASDSNGVRPHFCLQGG